MSADPARAVWFLDAAEDDVVAAFEWYESKRVGLGAEFVDAVDATLVSLVDFPRIARGLPPGYIAAVLMGRFPFEIFYRLEDGLVIVVACMHAARDPKAVLRRIGA